MHKKPHSSMNCLFRATTLCLRSPAATYHCLSTVLSLDLPSAMEYREVAISGRHKRSQNCHCSKSTLAPSASLASVPIAVPDSPQRRKLICCTLLVWKGQERRKQNWCCTKLVSILQALLTNLFCTGNKSLAVMKFLPTPEIPVEVPSLIFTFLVPGQ